MTVKEQLNATIESLENDQKIFEDIEFQYLEEETDWLAQREDLQTNLKIITKQISEKQKQIFHLEKQELNNHDLAATDTKLIEQDLLIVFNELQLNENNLIKIEKSLYELTGQQTTQSDSDEEDETELFRPVNNKPMSQSLFGGSQEILSSNRSKTFDVMSKSVNENMFSQNIEMSPHIEDNLTSTPKGLKTTIDISRDITNITKNGHQKLRKAEELDLSAINRSCSSDSLCTSSADSKMNISPTSLFKRSTDQETDPLLKLKYNLSSSFEQRSKSLPRQESVQKNLLNLSIESDDFEVNPMDRRAPSQDDIDRISKITNDSPISMLGASYKVKESIKEIERNRQILLAQQGSNVIEHERKKINELKKRCHDEARAQYLQLQNDVR